jgi:DNA-binding NarL/FixJ family response regulator
LSAHHRRKRAWAGRTEAGALRRRLDAVELVQALSVGDERRERLLGEARELAEPLGMTLLREMETAAPAGLSARELEVLKLLAAGSPYKEIGDELSIADKTVESHVRNIYPKIGVGSRAEAGAWAVRYGIV